MLRSKNECKSTVRSERKRTGCPTLKERRERNVLLQRTEKNAENKTFFAKNVKECRERNVLLKRLEKNVRTKCSFQKNVCPTLSFNSSGTRKKSDSDRLRLHNNTNGYQIKLFWVGKITSVIKIRLQSKLRKFTSSLLLPPMFPLLIILIRKVTVLTRLTFCLSAYVCPIL